MIKNKIGLVILVGLLIPSLLLGQKSTELPSKRNYAFDDYYCYGFFNKRAVEKINEFDTIIQFQLFQYVPSALDRNAISDNSNMVKNELEMSFRPNGSSFEGKTIYFKSRIPENNHKNPRTDLIQVEVNEIEVKDNQVKIEVDKNWLENYDLNYLSIETPLIDQSLNPSSLSGHIEITFKYIVDYEQTELSRDDIGNSFQLGNHTFKLHDIIENVLAIEILGEGEITEDIEMVNFYDDVQSYHDWDFKNNITYFRGNKENYYHRKNNTYGFQIFYKSAFEYTKTKLKMDQNSFLELIKNKRKEKDEIPSIIAFCSVAPIGQKILLIKPVYKIERLRIEFD